MLITLQKQLKWVKGYIVGVEIYRCSKKNRFMLIYTYIYIQPAAAYFLYWEQRVKVKHVNILSKQYTAG